MNIKVIKYLKYINLLYKKLRLFSKIIRINQIIYLI